MMLRDGGSIEITFLSVPLMYEPLHNQSILQAVENYHYLSNLELADDSSENDCLEVDILVGSDNYWKLVTGKVICEGDCWVLNQLKVFKSITIIGTCDYYVYLITIT